MAAWRLLAPHESTYVPSQETSGPVSSFSDLSAAVLGLPADPSSRESLFSTLASFLSLHLPGPPHPNAPALPRHCSSPVASSPSQRSRRHLATPLNDLRLGKHLTERAPFQIWDCILLFQYLGTSEWPWLLRQQVKLAKHPPSLAGEQRPGWLQESRERQHTAKAKQVKCLVFCLAPFRPYGRLCPQAFGHGEEEMSEEGTDIRLTLKRGQICCVPL